MFAIAVFGLPYLMTKMIRAMARSQEEELRRQQEAGAMTYTTGQNGEQIPIDPKKLDFCRVLYDYTPTPNSGGMDLEAKKGDFVAVLSKTDPMGNASEWWRCRARDGKMGYLPSPYLEPIQRPVQKTQQQLTEGGQTTSSAPGSRTQTMKVDPATQRLLEGNDRTKSLSSIYQGNSGMNKPVVPVMGPEVMGRPSDISAESFQKSAFYS